MSRSLIRITVAASAVLALSSTSAYAQDSAPQSAPAAAPTPAATPSRVAAPSPVAAPAVSLPPSSTNYVPQTRLQTRPYVPSYAPRGSRIVGYREVTRPQAAFWGPGLGLFLAGYVLNFAVLTPIANAISDDRDSAREEDAWAWSLLPIAGPIVQLGVGAPHPAIPITTGLMQIGGLVMFIYGLAEHETVRVPVHAGDPEDPSVPTIAFDASPLPGGGQVTVRLTHL